MAIIFDKVGRECLSLQILVRLGKKDSSKNNRQEDAGDG